jgi:mannose-1-phosphate guanylyltransferase
MLPPVLVLTAGLGTRLRPLSFLLAKPALPVAGVPLVRRILDWLASQGARDVILNLHHRAETITAVVGDGRACGLRVRYSWEQPVLGSGGGPARAFSLVDGNELIVVNGDTLTDVSLTALLEDHRQSSALVTLALVPHPNPARYGGVQLDADRRVAAFTPRARHPAGWHFVGVQVVDRRAYADTSTARPSESVSGLYTTLVRQRPGSVRGWTSDGGFDDVGTPLDYLETSIRLAGGDASALIDPGARVAVSAVLTRTIVWNEARIEDDVRLSDCIVASGVRVRRGSRYHRALLVPADAAPAGPQDRVDHDVLVAPITG